MTRTIACQAVGCGQQIAAGRFMCRPHWYSLPGPLRQDINAKWRARKAGADDGVRTNAANIVAHVEACDEARRWTADAEGRLANFTPDAVRIRRLYEIAEDPATDPARPTSAGATRITGEAHEH